MQRMPRRCCGGVVKSAFFKVGKDTHNVTVCPSLFPSSALKAKALLNFEYLLQEVRLRQVPLFNYGTLIGNTAHGPLTISNLVIQWIVPLPISWNVYLCKFLYLAPVLRVDSIFSVSCLMTIK